MASLDSMWAGCLCALCYVAVLPIILYQSDPVYHYLVVCSVVRGLRSLYSWWWTQTASETYSYKNQI